MLTNITKPNLLLVEDSEDDAFFFMRTLRKSAVDCSVHRVGDGAQALDFFRNASTSNPQTFPQVVFLDLKMPLLNGFEVLEWLRNQTFGAQMRVIVLSGSEHQIDKDRATQLGAVDYLVKPVRTSDLERLLREVCREKAEMGAHV